MVLSWHQATIRFLSFSRSPKWTYQTKWTSSQASTLATKKDDAEWSVPKWFYVAFIDRIFDKGYAEKVPKETVEADPGKVRYIPHHGVYHPEKPEKIRVVFDSSANLS